MKLHTIVYRHNVQHPVDKYRMHHLEVGGTVEIDLNDPNCYERIKHASDRLRSVVYEELNRFCREDLGQVRQPEPPRQKQVQQKTNPFFAHGNGGFGA